MWDLRHQPRVWGEAFARFRLAVRSLVALGANVRSCGENLPVLLHGAASQQGRVGLRKGSAAWAVTPADPSAEPLGNARVFLPRGLFMCWIHFRGDGHVWTGGALIPSIMSLPREVCWSAWFNPSVWRNYSGP